MIKREQLLRQRRAVDLCNEARRQAVKLIKQATAEAEQLRRQARSEGFQQGVLAAAAAVAEFFAARQRLGQSMQRQIDSHARELLTQAMTHADLPLLLLEEWLAEQAMQTPADTLTLLVPEAAGGAALHMERQINTLWAGKYKILRHPGSSFMMKYGDQVAEFNAGEFIDAATQQLASSPDYTGEARRLSEEGLYKLSELFTGYFAGQPAPVQEKTEYD